MLKAGIGDFTDFTRNKMSSTLGSILLVGFHIGAVVIYNLDS